LWATRVRNQELVLVLCLGQVPVTSILSLECPNHQGSTGLSYLSPMHGVNLVHRGAYLGRPLFSALPIDLILYSLSATKIVDSPSPEATATKQWDGSPLKRGYPQPSGQCEHLRQAPTLLEISLRYWGVTREATLLRSQ
jgi:hypothetical protein